MADCQPNGLAHKAVADFAALATAFERQDKWHVRWSPLLYRGRFLLGAYPDPANGYNLTGKIVVDGPMARVGHEDEFPPLAERLLSVQSSDLR
jgi:hypothetical protein